MCRQARASKFAVASYSVSTCGRRRPWQSHPARFLGLAAAMHARPVANAGQWPSHEGTFLSDPGFRGHPPAWNIMA